MATKQEKTTASQNAILKLDTKKYFEDALKEVVKNNPKVNLYALPQIEKVIINSGVGRLDEKQKQDAAEIIESLTSQKVLRVPAKKSIASFKLRQGQTVGLSTTLRKQKAKDFIFQLVYLALPRTRDFKGIKGNAFDANFKCYSLGIDSVSIFPSAGFDTKVNFGLQINIVFKSGSELNKELLTNLNFPFKK
jgi:large subunit ribosomal protein L5